MFFLRPIFFILLLLTAQIAAPACVWAYDRYELPASTTAQPIEPIEPTAKKQTAKPKKKARKAAAPKGQEEKKKWSGFAIASLIIGLLGIALIILALISNTISAWVLVMSLGGITSFFGMFMAIFGAEETYTKGKRSKAIALLGFITSFITVLTGLFYLIFFVV